MVPTYLSSYKTSYQVSNQISAKHSPRASKNKNKNTHIQNTSNAMVLRDDDSGGSPIVLNETVNETDE